MYTLENTARFRADTHENAFARLEESDPLLHGLLHINFGTFYDAGFDGFK